MRIHQLTPSDALRSLRSGAEGLSSGEARRRLREFGPNEVERARRTPLALRLGAEFTHFFALILWLAAGLAFWADWNDPGQGMGVLGSAIIAVIVINGMFSFWQVYKAEKALEALEKLLPRRAKVLRDGAFAEISIAELVPGDVISIEAGDLVSADCRLIEAFDIRVNNATVTGESLPQLLTAEPSRVDDLLHASNALLAGTTVVSGDGKAVVCATGAHTEFGRIARLAQSAGETTFPLQREIAFLSRVVAVLATVLGVVFFLIGLTIPLSFWQNFLFAIGIIVANVPEGLLPTVTLALAMGAQRMARRNVLIRHLPAVETLGCATVICTDKTGTLTENRMTVVKVYLGNRWHEVSSNDPTSELVELHRPFFEGARLCENIKQTNGQGRSNLLGDPMEVALVQFATRALPDARNQPRLDEIPFDSDRKRISTLHRISDGLVLYCKGALESLMPLCTTMRAEDGQPQTLSEEVRNSLLAAQGAMADMGLRVLALASRPVREPWQRADLERDLILEGLVALEDPPRAEVPAAIEKCRAAGIRIIMLTGDHPQTAVGIGRQIGLIRSPDPLVISGDHLRRISDNQLQIALDAPEIIFARIGADQKMRIVTLLQRKGEVVAVTGDGVNDAPALKQADIGIAMGVTGTDVARETADMVLADDNFASIVAAIEEGRAVFDNVRKFLTYILTSNIPEVVPYLAFVLFRIPLPLTIIQILAVDLGTDMLPALALGAERADSDVMQRPPRSREERLLTWPLLARAYLFLGIIEAAAAMTGYFFVLKTAGWVYGEMISPGDTLYLAYREATTACLAAIVATQIANVFLCRSERRSMFPVLLRENPLILAGIAVELVLIAAISYSYFGNVIFGTAPLAAEVWIYIAAFPIVMIALEETRKWLVRRRKT